MKSPAILFSFPLLVTLLAAQSRGQTADVSSAAAPVAEDCCPARKAEPTGGTRARVETGESERMHLKIRGQRRPVEVMSGQVFVQSRNGKERVHRFAGGKGVAGASREAVRLREFSKGADEVSLVAYHPDRPRTEDHMFLVSAAVNVRLMEGVDRKVFFAASGALRAKLMDFAPDALVLDYASAAEAIEAAEMLSEMPGVLSASQVIAVKRMPEFLPNEQYFSPTGPNYNPPPQTDNVDGHTCPANLCGMVPTSGYAWWANNRASLIRPSPRRLGPGPVNSVASQLDLGDLPPIPYDPLFPKLQGEMSDIRLPLAWENRVSTVERVSGFNQKILIIDDGIVSKHPDLGAALGAAQAVDLLNTHHINMYTRQNSAEPEEPQFDAHGTGLAGIVAARKNSSDFAGGAGIVGVAPRSTLQSVVGIKRFIRDDRWAEAFAYGTTQTDTDGDGNFWEHKRSGMVDFDICLNASSEQGSGSAVDLFPEDYLWHQAINFGATEQRAYKGVIYVTSAGNGAGGGGGGHMNVNYMEQKNSIYQIPVGGVSDLGRRIGRSNAGAALVCVAPTWGDELPPVFRWPNAPAGWPRVGHLTAPLPISVEPALPFFKNPPVGPDDLPTAWRRVTQGITTLGPTTKSSTGLLTYSHTFDFTGTSASAAQVAGIVALMLEINPALSYRDVKEILLRSSRVVNDVRVNTLAAIAPASNPNALWPTQWRMSSLGRPLNHAFGAGLIDANRAIKIARLWTNLPIEPRSIVPVNFDPDKPAYEKVITQRDRHTGGIYIPKPSSELIPTNGTWKEIIIPPPISGMRLEHIEVRIRLYHHRRGDLEIKLVAPQDINWDAEMPEPMESVLFAPHRDDSRTSYYDGPPPAGQTFNASNTPTDWTFTTLRHWGTVAGTGQWKLMIRDAVQLGTSNTPVQVTVPDKDTGDSSFISRQKLDGIAVTYHGAASVTNINNPPEVSKSLRLSFSAGPTPRVTLLKANVGSSGAGGAVPFPVTSWDMYDSSEICPIQPSNPTRAPFEFFPPGRGHFGIPGAGASHHPEE